MEAHQQLNIICKVRSLKSRIKTPSLLEDIIPSHNEVFKDIESDMVLGIRKLSNSTGEAVKRYIIGQYHAASTILTLGLWAWKKSVLWDIACISVKLYTWTYLRDWQLKTVFRTMQRSSLLCSILSPDENCWRGDDAHFEEVVAMSSGAFLPLKVADRSIID